MKVRVVLTLKNKKVKRYLNCSSRRIFRSVEAIDWKLAHIQVLYGYQKNQWGKRVMFDNEGIYTNRRDFRQAYKAFLEE